MKPYCFVLMPFGRKADEGGRPFEFDRIYAKIIAPAVEDADLDPIRADEEMVGGLIHKPMFERLMLCDYAVADLTTANPNVLYELGIRHGVRPHSTVVLAASGTRLPFDVLPLRAIMYEVDAQGRPVHPEESRSALTDRLRACRNPADDSPVYQLLTHLPRPSIDRLKTDTFRDLIEYSKKMKRRLAEARRTDADAVRGVEEEIDVVDADPAIVVDLFLSYREVEAWSDMVELVEKMPHPLRGAILVQEQLGLALNRLGRREEAERALREIIDKHGPSSETNGILGRVFKDRWDAARESGDPAAPAHLRRAIDTYLEGFESDWRDAYPGINAVTLMEMTDPVDERQQDLIPVVRYAAVRRCATTTPDYWDYAALLELAVLTGDGPNAEHHLAEALAMTKEPWKSKTTARNLSLIREKREERGQAVDWITRLEGQLLANAAKE